MRWFNVVLAVFLLSSNPYALAQGVSEGVGSIEELLGLTVNAEGVTFQVRTGGCTRPENFKVQRYGTAPIQLLLTRTVADPCDAFFPYGTTFTVSYSQLRLADGEEFVVLNPISTTRAVAQP